MKKCPSCNEDFELRVQKKTLLGTFSCPKCEVELFCNPSILYIVLFIVLFDFIPLLFRFDISMLEPILRYSIAGVIGMILSIIVGRLGFGKIVQIKKRSNKR